MPHSCSRTIVTTILPLAFTLAIGCGAESPPAGRETPFQKQSLALSTGITLAYVEAGDPAGEPGRVATARGEATLIEYRPRNCPVGQGGDVG